MTETKWLCYEKVARYLLDQFANELGFQRVESKQHVPGHRSGTRWEIDGKAVDQDGNKFAIVECRRYTTSGLTQEDMAALAYRIQDTGAAGGILVSPLPPQKGAQKVARSEGILHVQLVPDSTIKEYLFSFLNKTFAGIHDQIAMSDHVDAEVRDANGSVISRS